MRNASEICISQGQKTIKVLSVWRLYTSFTIPTLGSKLLQSRPEATEKLTFNLSADTRDGNCGFNLLQYFSHQSYT